MRWDAHWAAWMSLRTAEMQVERWVIKKVELWVEMVRGKLVAWWVEMLVE